MSQFDNVSVVKAANIYFGGSVHQQNPQFSQRRSQDPRHHAAG
jgi:hypothetical protein